MNSRQRFIETMTFGSPDRPAAGDYMYYEATRERWEREGLPRDADLREYFELDFSTSDWRLAVNLGAFSRSTLITGELV